MDVALISDLIPGILIQVQRGFWARIRLPIVAVWLWWGETCCNFYKWTTYIQVCASQNGQKHVKCMHYCTFRGPKLCIVRLFNNWWMLQVLVLYFNMYAVCTQIPLDSFSKHWLLFPVLPISEWKHAPQSWNLFTSCLLEKSPQKIV